MNKKALARFSDKVDTSAGNESCWLWKAGKDRGGYGTFKLASLTRIAHRIMFTLITAEEIPDDLHCLHSCDTPTCVQPRHLFLGTHTDNMQDMMRKDRCGHAGGASPGEAHGLAKLTDANVREIRKRYATGGVLQRELADEYGVVLSQISAVVNRKNWKHVA